MEKTSVVRNLADRVLTLPLDEDLHEVHTNSVPVKRDSNLELFCFVLMLLNITHHYVVNSGVIKIFDTLAQNGIIARKYFYLLTNSFAAYKYYPTADVEKTPVARYLADRVLTLPLYADLSLENVDVICQLILK